MDEHILDTPCCHAAMVHPGRLAGRKGYSPVSPMHQCCCCGYDLVAMQGSAAVLASHLIDPRHVKCLNHYGAIGDLVGIGDQCRGLVIVSTLHTFRAGKGQWFVRGVAPAGVLRDVAVCRGKQHAHRILAMFLAPITEVTTDGLHGNNAG
jgi:hypothetical protein